MKTQTAVLTVLGKDQPGIIARVTEFLFKLKCNLEDVSMTVLEGEFAMILMVDFKTAAIRKAFEKKIGVFQKKWKLTCFVKDLKTKPKRGNRHAKNTEAHVISAIGKDRSGIVYQISQLCARYRLNITDLDSRILGAGKNAIYALLLEVDIPKRFAVKKLKSALTSAAKRLKIEVNLKSAEQITL